MSDRSSILRAVLQLGGGLLVIVGVLTGSQVLLLLAVMAVVGLLLWEFEVRRRGRA